MQPRNPLAVLSLVALIAAACGGSTDSTPSASGSATSPAAGTSAKVTVVPHESLQALLPDLPGWTRGEVKGDTDRTESVSRVTVDYDKGESTVSVELMDSSLNPNLLASIKDILKAPVASPGTTVATSTIAGFPAAEEWTAEAKNGVVHVLVADRFMLAVTGSTVPDLATLRRVAETIDLRKLASLK
jgi:hypothetical protein